MSEHALDWLDAYHDGELHGDRLRWVDAHLRTCAACQAELATLRSLSARLQASPPMPAHTPPEQFVAQVRLRLGRQPATGRRGQVPRAAGLWLPLGVAGLWAWGQALLAAAAVALFALPASLPALVPPLPAVGGPLPLLLALAAPPGWGGWLSLLALDIGLTLAVTLLAWGCLAGLWAAGGTASETSPLAPGLPGNRTTNR